MIPLGINPLRPGNCTVTSARCSWKPSPTMVSSARCRSASCMPPGPSMRVSGPFQNSSSALLSNASLVSPLPKSGNAKPDEGDSCPSGEAAHKAVSSNGYMLSGTSGLRLHSNALTDVFPAGVQVKRPVSRSSSFSMASEGRVGRPLQRMFSRMLSTGSSCPLPPTSLSMTKWLRRLRISFQSSSIESFSCRTAFQDGS